MKPPFEQLLERAGETSRLLLEAVRTEVLRLGPDVVEDVRMHRIVYGRRHALRRFLDLQPATTGLHISVRAGRGFSDLKKQIREEGSGWVSLEIRSEADVDYVMKLIRQAYSSV